MPVLDERRVVWRFLLWPYTVAGETRWLEKAGVVQVYRWDGHWDDVCWHPEAPAPDADPRGLFMLKPNHAGALVLNTGETVNYGVVRVTDADLVYMTGDGMREALKRRCSEAELELAGMIRTVPLSSIARVMF